MRYVRRKPKLTVVWLDPESEDHDDYLEQVDEVFVKEGINYGTKDRFVVVIDEDDLVLAAGAYSISRIGFRYDVAADHEYAEQQAGRKLIDALENFYDETKEEMKEAYGVPKWPLRQYVINKKVESYYHRKYKYAAVEPGPSGMHMQRNPAHPKGVRRAMAIALAKARIRSWDVQGNYDHIIKFFAQVMDVTPEEAERRLMERDPEDEPIFQLYRKTMKDLVNHRFMLPPSKNWVYVNHTTGLRDGPEYNWDFTKLIKKILREGVVPQAEGSGRYSECPGAIFGIGDYPRGQKWGDRLYNMSHFPWITFRVPKTQWSPRGGNVCTFSRIPAKDIVGVCGLPASVMRKELGV